MEDQELGIYPVEKRDEEQEDQEEDNTVAIEPSKPVAVAFDWIEQSKQLGLAIFERQPEENDLDWYIWTVFRAHYPLRMPKWSEIAKECNASVATVLKASQKWNFAARLQAWARVTDDSMLEERSVAIKIMNTKQLTMAQKLQMKIEEAIEFIDPQLLKPSELVAMMKLANELEAKITMMMPEKVAGTVMDTAVKQNAQTKPEDMAEIIEILRSTGAFEGKTVGIEKTTTRLIAKEADGGEEYV